MYIHQPLYLRVLCCNCRLVPVTLSCDMSAPRVRAESTPQTEISVLTQLLRIIYTSGMCYKRFNTKQSHANEYCTLFRCARLLFHSSLVVFLCVTFVCIICHSNSIQWHGIEFPTLLTKLKRSTYRYVVTL